MGRGKKESNPRYIKAPEVILRMKDLSNAEKLVLIVLCRYWPNPYWGSNQNIAELLGFSERYVEKIIKRLAEKKKIFRNYAHRKQGNKIKTGRVIVPKCLPGRCELDVKWIKTEQMDGQQTEQADGSSPNKCSLSPEQMDDLLEIDKKENNKQMPKRIPLTLEQTKQRQEKMIQDLLEDEK